MEWFTATPPKPKPPIVYHCPIERTLRKGDKGKDVEELQKMLNKLGYNCGKIDGIFGAKTASAVKSFQKANNLVVDGIFGKKSLAMLNKLLTENDVK